MKLCYICSPYHGEMEANRQNAVRYCAYAQKHGVVPLAPHTIFTQYLDDNIPQQREEGLQMGLELLKRCNEIWVCGNTVSQGMRQEIKFARDLQIPVKYIPEAVISEDFTISKSVCENTLLQKLSSAKSKSGNINRAKKSMDMEQSFEI